MVFSEIVAAIGVEAVVEGLGEFKKDMGSINDLIGNIGKSGTTAEKSLGPLNRAFEVLGESLRRIGEFVIGGLLVRGIESITSALSTMVSSVIDSAASFQSLEIRLQGLLAAELFEAGSVDNFADALSGSIKPAKDLFFWVQNLALQTPFDIQDVANVVTLGKAYGFTTDMTKELTTSTINFTAGMGLSDEVMERIITNFGQMVQQGKITGTELRDLGRGAFLPINDLLARTSEKLGIVNADMDDLRATGTEGVNAFMESFIDLVGERFPEAGDRASRTMEGVKGNLRDLFEGVVAFNIVKPILDSISSRMADFLDLLTEGERGQRLLKSTEILGQALKEIVEIFFGALPSQESIADKIIEVVETLAGKAVGLKTIIQSVAEGEVTARQGLDAALLFLGLPQDFVSGLNAFIDTIIGIKEKIDAFFLGLGEGGIAGGLINIGVDPELSFAIGDMVTALGDLTLALKPEEFTDFGEEFDKVSRFLREDGPDVTQNLTNIANAVADDLVPALLDFGQWAVDNEDTILNLLNGIVDALIAMEDPASAMIVPLENLSREIGKIVGQFEDTETEITGISWGDVGRSVVDGLVVGINSAAPGFGTALLAMATGGWNTVVGFFDSRSPSQLAKKLGHTIPQGLALGVQELSGLPTKAMETTVTHMIQPAAAAMGALASGNVSNTTNNFNMNINSNARTEPIIGNYRLMQAMAEG